MTGVRRVPPTLPAELAVKRPSFACAYAVDIPPGDSRTSEQWAREVWEGAPRVLRWFMTAGWRGFLRLRLSPGRPADHILGWPVVVTSPHITMCSSRSPFLTAYNSFVREDRRVVWSTFVSYDRRIAHLIWPVAAALHRPLVRLSLARAARRR